MKIYIIADTHFCHKNIIKLANRSFSSVTEMNETMIKRWKNSQEEDSLFYHLGDFGIGKVDKLCEILWKVRRNVILIRGNHDLSLKRLMEIGFNGIADRLILKYRHWTFDMTHRPSEDPKYDKMDHNEINLHGHLHSITKIKGNRINMGVEAWDYRPISLDEIMKEYIKYKKKIYKKI